ncbi:hypothetical protein K474DRAFT_610689 [Panus rudis PR-1116 ss-1]|nr:hypothetical protein K474DRAFT_610689 [Panus rudis PR-1116 ss-1]
MNSPANNISITTLPPRLLYRILDELYLSDLLRCTEVCTVLNRVVHGIPSLQYKVELAKQALEDIPSNTLPASRKLALIRQYEAAWTKHFSSSLSKATLPMIDPMRWTLRGGVLARLVEDFKLDLFKPARVIRGTPQMHWALELSDRPYQFDIDVDQSLLIMVLQIEDDSSRHYLSLRDLNTGMKPRSARSSILPIPDHLTNPCYDIATFGNKLAVMPRWNLHDDPKFNVVIWDWQLGLPVLVSLQSLTSTHASTHST